MGKLCRVRKKQFGRSMIEMLLTLSLIGVLVIGAMWGLNKALTKHNANSLIEDVRLAGFIVADEMFPTLPANQEEVSLAGHFDKKSPYDFSVFKENGVSGQASISFAIVADHVPYNVCMEVKDRKVEWLEEILPNGKENICYNDRENGVSFFFNTQLNTEVTKERLCETNTDCGTEAPFCCAGTCQVSEECECPEGGEWRKVVNYIGDGSETILGQICCKREYDTAVDGICCDASKPYCKQVSYLESTGTQYIDIEHQMTSSDLKISMNIETASIPSKETNLFSNIFQNQPNVGRITGGFHNNLIFLYSRISASGTSDGNIYTTENSNPPINTPFNIEFIYDKNSQRRAVVIDGNVVGSSNVYNTTLVGSPSLLLLYHSQAASSDNAAVKVYSAKILDNGAFVRDFIPVVDNNGKAGMYDKVSERVFYNSGTGKFIAGE